MARPVLEPPLPPATGPGFLSTESGGRSGGKKTHIKAKPPAGLNWLSHCRATCCVDTSVHTVALLGHPRPGNPGFSATLAQVCSERVTALHLCGPLFGSHLKGVSEAPDSV